jgi:hypothetical protein
MARGIFHVNRYPIPIIFLALHTGLMIWNECSTGTIKDDPSVGTGLLFLCNFADIPAQMLWGFLGTPLPWLSFLWIFGTLQWLAIGLFMQIIYNRGR